ncbi:type I polyketide synthase [uncultured Corynebacterium sp.]|uniref:type I polyketide synthase n=1 Tax=uncultured Corynebacterium sp. TaxID=159447 RepID=UPI0025EDF69E|nr:type I polyketide synthase [uncultured Corynebacterium sp.]
MTNTSFLSRLNSADAGDQRATLLFGGQATAWRAGLTDLAEDPSLADAVRGVLTDSTALIAPVAAQLTAATAGALTLERLTGAKGSVSAALSVPGITVAQFGQLAALKAAGYDATAAVADERASVLGHSQGVLGAALVDGRAGDPAHVVAIARLIGAAASRLTRSLGVSAGEATPMLSVRGLDRATLDAVLVEVAEAAGGAETGVQVAIRNGHRRFILSGSPEDLGVVEKTIAVVADKDAAELAAKIRGGAPLAPVCEYLDVTVPFHHDMMEPAVARTVAWAETCGLNTDGAAEKLARAVLTDHVDWVEGIVDALALGTTWFLDLGPGDTVARLSADLVEGSGAGLVAAGTLAAVDGLAAPGGDPDRTVDWSSFAPRLLDLPTGRTVETAFTRLTGRSPVLLAGMTPTTVDPEIVAAAANAGYWAEMAGGGQVTAEVFEGNLTKLKGLLDPGRAVQFNAMFMDRYLWNLHFGTQRVVAKARESGAPFDGVVISAGIPEPDEAPEVIGALRDSGFSHIALKPGTVAQIRAGLGIARQLEETGTSIILQVEDGHAGGHHSWENLDDLLTATYAEIRRQPNVVLCVGGGIGTPERAADYLTGAWATALGLPAMPVDGIMVGTAAMTAKEAKTTPEIKQLLVDTPGVADGTGSALTAPNGGWIAPGQSAGGATSGLSHLRADIHEVDNSAAKCMRLIQEIGSNLEAVNARRDEIIAALNKTAKPYFGDLEEMTYAQVVRRFAELSFPWVDPSWLSRFHLLLQRVEARLSDVDHGEVVTLFPTEQDAADPTTAIEALVDAYPASETDTLTPLDAAWFLVLCRKFPKPVGFVPAIDEDLLAWWGKDCLWQSQDTRYSADQVRIIPGPVSVSGITTVDEPVASILGRFEDACRERVAGGGGAPTSTGRHSLESTDGTGDSEITTAWSRISDAADVASFLKATPYISWTGHLMDNPAHVIDEDRYELIVTGDGSDGGPVKVTVDLHLDTFWDGTPAGEGEGRVHAVRRLPVPLILSDAVASGALPVVDEEKLPETMYGLLAGTAGVGNTSVTDDVIERMPAKIEGSETDADGEAPFGKFSYTFHLTDSLGAQHAGVTGAGLPDLSATGSGSRSDERATIVPDALLGTCWPAIYAALGSALVDGYPVIEGLLNAVHLDHSVALEVPADEIATGEITVTSWAAGIEESSSGRVVTVHHHMFDAAGELLGRQTERFAIRGRAFGTTPPADPAPAGGIDREITDTPRSTLLRTRVNAPAEMTPFAWVSGDFNPIHTSHVAARVAGLRAPLVHGMWLSATTQHAASAAGSGHTILGWTYRMFGLVQLGDPVDIQVERVGRVAGGGLLLDVTCRINDELVSQGTAVTAAPTIAYVYPGQGIQAKGMGLDERAASKATAEVWERADRHTREALDFSILTVVRDNPTELTAKGVTYHHPDGVLYLTQFTQVALATLALAQTARLREADALVADAYYAGHSLGEYTALSAYAGTIDLETVLEVVFHRGSTMHHLIPRDEHGRSNYRMGALRPNQFGVDDEHVVEYVNSVAEASGEFLEIVNFNLAGEQYSIAGTVAGLAALEKDAAKRTAEHGGKGSFMMVPGIDVPFHSRVLHPGVPDFREKLDGLLPERINHEILIGRYIPNLVARPFELTEDFVRAILDVVPSGPAQALLDDWAAATADDAAAAKTARTLFIELLCWQFASPVRWIETQDLLFAPDRLDIDEVVEVGLGASPTLANLATKTLKLPRFSAADVAVRNVQRDEKLVYHTDQQTIDSPVYEDEGSAPTSAPTSVPVGDTVLSHAEASAKAPSESVPESLPAPVTEVADLRTAPAVPAGAVERPADLPYKASDAIRTLLAYANKLRPEQIGGADTTGTLTNGVSSRLNQLLMDISAELGLSAVEGAAEADVDTLSVTVDNAAHNYSAFGPVLGEAVKDRLRKLFGAAGAKAQAIADRVTGTWELGPGWVDHTTAQILLGSRDGASSRGGDLATLATAATTMNDVNAIIDEAVAQVGAAHGIPVAIPAAGGAGGGGTVDSAALDAFAEGVTGATGVLATTARHILAALDLDVPESAALSDEEGAETAAVLEAVSAELGANWPASVAPSFDAARTLLIDDRWATAREDVARLANGEELADTVSFRGTGETVATHAEFRAARAEEKGDTALAARFRSIAADARSTEPGAFEGRVAVVTGVTPASIAGGVVGDLLAEGATVVMTASRVSSARLEFAKKLYREHASASARIWLAPANLSSYRDIDALVDWIGTEQTETVGPDQKLIKPALVPDLFLPFAAPSVSGTVEDAGGNAEIQTRLLLWSVERSFTALSRIGHEADLAHRLHVVLPGSPNRGTFGGDGAYGEVKAAFDAICNKWSNEPWGERVTIAHPRIGWVAGTGLMGGNDPLVDAAVAAGVHVWSPAEISGELLALCSEDVRAQALAGPVDADLTGGLGRINLTELRDRAVADGVFATDDTAVVEDAGAPATVNALPSPVRVAQPVGSDFPADAWGEVTADLDDMVVIVGLGEIGAWGSGRTRNEAELGIRADGSVDLSAAGVLELAWMTGLLTWNDTPVAGWYDVDGNIVPEEEIYARYRDEVAARSGVRTFVDDVAIDDLTTPQEVEIFLDHEVTFTVDSAEDAATFVDNDPTFTRANHDPETGEWSVTRLPGARTRVPRRATLARKVGGQFPTDFDPARWGIPASMIEAVDRIAVWNLVTAVDAYLSAGFTPAEILQAVHPSDVAMTQGTGFGGMTSMRKLFVDRFLEEDIPSDVLQETLPNVIAAHTMQSFVGGYGAMIHPVGACATAAVSVEEGADKIRLGKADFVVAGATDDINVESITGFANMNATADSDKMAAKGLNERFYSRANDRRRGGFVEAQGGGTILLARGSVAAELGLPVKAVVGYAASFADGAHTSIPAPGQGALAAGRGGRNSRLAKDLRTLGVSADDIAVVSKHDTSTNANDPNESKLHTKLAAALGRTPGNPLYVVSQKTLTGHAKGGAAVFQTAGLSDIFRSSTIPANRSLDCVDPEMASSPDLVWLREPLQLSRTVKAGLLTSLGFGHVSALLALVHPEAFRVAVASQLGEDAAAVWVEKASSRLRAGVRRREAGMLGHRALFEEIEHRRFADGVDIDEAEPAMLLDPAARAGEDGLFR